VVVVVVVVVVSVPDVVVAVSVSVVVLFVTDVAVCVVSVAVVAVTVVVVDVQPPAYDASVPSPHEPHTLSLVVVAGVLMYRPAASSHAVSAVHSRSSRPGTKGLDSNSVLGLHALEVPHLVLATAVPAVATCSAALHLLCAMHVVKEWLSCAKNVPGVHWVHVFVCLFLNVPLLHFCAVVVVTVVPVFDVLVSVWVVLVIEVAVSVVRVTLVLVTVDAVLVVTDVTVVGAHTRLSVFSNDVAPDSLFQLAVVSPVSKAIVRAQHTVFPPRSVLWAAVQYNA